MKLCEEYCIRNSNIKPQIKHVSQGFCFFGEEQNLLIIKWQQHGCHPGFYDFHECVLQDRIRLKYQKLVAWDEYEDYVLSWCKSNSILFNKTKIFETVWEFFVKRNESFLAENYNPQEVFVTLDEESKERTVSIINFIEKLQAKHPFVYDIWQHKISNIIFNYNHWMRGLCN
jgi:hypothetical protein